MLRSYLLLIFCVTAWGSNFVFGKMLVAEFSPLFLSAMRLLFIVLFLLIWSRGRLKMPKLSRTDWLLLAVLGVVGVFINQWSFYKGLVTADPTTSALILALTPITTALLAALFLKESLTGRMAIGSVIGTSGVLFVIYTGAELHFDVGILWIVLTMLTFATSIILVRLLGHRLPPLVTTLVSNLIGFGSMLPFVLISIPTATVSTSLSSWILLFVTAVVMHGIVTLIWNSQLQKVGAAKAAMFANLEPFIAMLFGLLLLAKPVTAVQFFGAILIIAGVTLTTTSKDPREKKKLSSLSS
ncbi:MULTISPECIES: DMT family transporter [Brevibacillus]|uniref:DMT family transporter n=1 Tax=Brevibacillus TaxID=55080 RepID=UPI000D110729|nr:MULTISPECIES: DMT family transporter [Brevibacillus]PSJ69091.1 EamA family transporter [Brevibacillus brevis]RED32974.1 threonine/homoserine efflux transporter RhtA [Brevibacillus brevis]TQK73898.1 threonine/homoserine efflux transporter RhtA [Brevibacillus sp. AG162]VEF90644.1 Probable amino-acid metabolite efflux pump [Brevibacillus brevis]GEC90436.1 membrane protein [Brevibacillus brevis]